MNVLIKSSSIVLGYGGVPPVEGMQNLDLNDGGGDGSANLSATPTAASNAGGDNLNFDPDPMPSPPQDNNQVAAWYDTDL